MDIHLMTLEQKANLVYELVKDVVEETLLQDKHPAKGLMEVFGEEYVFRMETFASIFNSK